ncbi:uncharacterized acetyltransferase At3g50280-like [Impatiens glandulifera]|uniref:uncharacterized acetyltransferase At3g50280-like n=1 Tax=Impatiens glandulifera TaxID=253017 RepID=UPI001FB04B01|nr:uncharacterized acetyltransferase At3g50280-like [Impatiens glandulifera]
MPASSSSPSNVTVISKCTVFPDQKSSMEDLKLSVSDLPMLSCHYIQKGVLFTRPSIPIDFIISLLKHALSRTLSLFPPLAGRLTTDHHGYVYITCNDAGADFIHAVGPTLHIRDILSPIHVPESAKSFFSLDRTVSYDGHFKPILLVQVTDLVDGLFIGCSVNHAVSDGTSFWNFFNTFSEVCRNGTRRITKSPDFKRESVLISSAVLKIPEGGPKVTFNADAPIKERIFSFSRESIQRLKAKANGGKWVDFDCAIPVAELMGKINNNNDKTWVRNSSLDSSDISSFQALCAVLWRAVTRARKFPSEKMTTFRMAVNYRQRLEPKMDPYYFGNAIQSIPTYATAGDVMSRDLRWCAEQLNKNVLAHGDATVRKFVADWERDPRCFPLGNFDGAMMTMGSSPRFPMYENDFGWGKPLAVRSGRANKFDGKISAFPGRVGGGSVDLEVVLAPETMSCLESDQEFMQYITAAH